MSQRLSDYLTQETTDYLEQLDRLLMAPGAPDPGSLLRLARGVRGSAQMAGVETIAAVAERLEDAGRSVLSNTIIWSEDTRQLAIHTVRDLKVLVRALNRWGPAEEASSRRTSGDDCRRKRASESSRVTPRRGNASGRDGRVPATSPAPVA